MLDSDSEKPADPKKPEAPDKIHIGLADGLKMCVYRYRSSQSEPSGPSEPSSEGAKTPTICIPGLTRNASDFADLAPKIAATGRDVFTVSLRGRGESEHDRDITHYHPLVYRDDILRCLDVLDIRAAVFVGTSLGAMVTMLANQTAPSRVAAAVINDIGPDLAAEGLARIAGYVGAVGEKPPAPLTTLEEAAASIRAVNEIALPDGDDEFWRLFARRTYRQTPAGQWVLDYDPGIGRAFAEAPPPPDLWSGFESLKNKPTLVIRGAISDLLTLPIIKKMRAVHQGFDYCEVARVGHAPTLGEPAAWEAIENFLHDIA